MTTLLAVRIRVEGRCKGAAADEHMGYEIEIETSSGTILIFGNHDSAPEFVELPDELRGVHLRGPYDG